MTERTATDPAAGSARPPSAGDESVWAAAAAAVLRRAGRLAADAPDADAWDRLARSTVEGLPVPPLGTPERAASVRTRAAIAVDPGLPPFLRGSATPAGAGGGWDVRALIADPDPAAANRAVLADLEGGVTSLWIRVGDGGCDPGRLAAVLDGVYLDMAPVVLDAAGDGAALPGGRALAELARARSVTLHPDGNLGADPIGRVAAEALGGAADAESRLADLPELTALARDLGVRAVIVDGTVAHDAGAGDAGEIGYTLAAGAGYLRTLTAAGLDVDTACGLMEFRYAATDDQFATIAKLRAARFAWSRVAELSGATPSARAQRQHTVTSAAMLTRYDPWVNLLRTTVAAFAAGVGGATAVTVLPFDSALGIPDAFGRRMARNISALLLGEAHVGAVTDPAGGAHAVEMLTAELAEAAWAEFDRIESAGGILTALADGSLARRVASTRAERGRRIATRRQPITGVSEFPNAADELPERRPLAGGAGTHRWAEPFEALRDDPPASPVLLITVGNPMAASARLLFTRNLLAAGGIGVTEPDAHTDAERSVRQAGCRTVVLAGADADYADDAQGLAATATIARAAEATAVFVAGRPAAVLDSLPDDLIDGTVAAGDDVLAFLNAVRATLRGDQR